MAQIFCPWSIIRLHSSALRCHLLLQVDKRWHCGNAQHLQLKRCRVFLQYLHSSVCEALLLQQKPGILNPQGSQWEGKASWTIPILGACGEIQRSVNPEPLSLLSAWDLGQCFTMALMPGGETVESAEKEEKTEEKRKQVNMEWWRERDGNKVYIGQQPHIYWCMHGADLQGQRSGSRFRTTQINTLLHIVFLYQDDAVVSAWNPLHKGAFWKQNRCLNFSFDMIRVQQKPTEGSLVHFKKSIFKIIHTAKCIVLLWD